LGDPVIESHAQRIGSKKKSVAVIIVGVENDPEAIVFFRTLIAAAFGRDYFLRLRIQAGNSEVDGVLRIDNPDLRLLTRRFAFPGLSLDKVCRGLRWLPEALALIAIH